MRLYFCYITIIFFAQTAVLGQSHVTTDFAKTKGTWMTPIDKIVKIDTMGPCYYPCDLPRGLTIETDSNRVVRSVQTGQIVLVTFIGDNYAVIIRNNNYLVCYSGLKSITHKKGDNVTAGQDLGIIAGDENNPYELELILYNGDKDEHRIQDWFSEDFRKIARLKK